MVIRLVLIKVLLVSYASVRLKKLGLLVNNILVHVDVRMEQHVCLMCSMVLLHIHVLVPQDFLVNFVTLQVWEEIAHLEDVKMVDHVIFLVTVIVQLDSLVNFVKVQYQSQQPL